MDIRRLHLNKKLNEKNVDLILRFKKNMAEGSKTYKIV